MGNHRTGTSWALAGLFAAWLVIFVAFCLALPESFPTVRNLETLSRQTSITAIAALGMTLVIVAGGIDLSVGSVAALAGVAAAFVLQRGLSPEVACLAALGVGALAGLLNGALVTKLRLGAFIVTLGTLLAMRGLAKGLAGEQAIRADAGWIEKLLASGSQTVLAPGVLLAIALAAGAGFLLRRTRFGRYLVAVGANERAARYSAVPVDRVRLLAFTLCGLMAGLAGLLYLSRLRVGDPTIAQGFELEVVAAVVIGGASLSGGKGTIAGAMLGAMIMSTIRAGGSQLGWSNWIQEVATGAIIVLAVTLDQIRTRRAG